MLSEMDVLSHLQHFTNILPSLLMVKHEGMPHGLNGMIKAGAGFRSLESRGFHSHPMGFFVGMTPPKTLR